MDKRAFRDDRTGRVELGETAVVVMAQAPEVLEGDHLQVWPGQRVRQLLADGFKA
jgi:hypothetical protein